MNMNMCAACSHYQRRLFQLIRIPHPRNTKNRFTNASTVISFFGFSLFRYTRNKKNWMHASRTRPLSQRMRLFSFFVSVFNIFYICSAACFIGIRNAFSKHCTHRDTISIRVHKYGGEEDAMESLCWRIAKFMIDSIVSSSSSFFLIALRVVCAIAASRYTIALPLGRYAQCMLSDRIFLLDKHEQSHMWPSTVYVDRAFIVMPTSSSLIVRTCVACLEVDALPHGREMGKDGLEQQQCGREFHCGIRPSAGLKGHRPNQWTLCEMCWSETCFSCLSLSLRHQHNDFVFGTEKELWFYGIADEICINIMFYV